MKYVVVIKNQNKIIGIKFLKKSNLKERKICYN